MGLSGEIVDFIRSYFFYDMDQARGIGKITMVENKFTIALVRVLVEVVDSIGIKKRCSSFDTMYFVAFFE